MLNMQVQNLLQKNNKNIDIFYNNNMLCLNFLKQINKQIDFVYIFFKYLYNIKQHI